MPALDFWYSIGSTYSYLTVMRISDLAAARGVAVSWRPYNVREIMLEQNNIPFANKPNKTAYMWRDIERRAARFGLPARIPAPYPLVHLPLANQVAVIAARDGWCEAYSRETYRRWFQEGEPAGSEPNLSASIAAAGQDPAPVLQEASGEAGIALLAAETDVARKLGIFGSPSFMAGSELFWGDDRLEEALDWVCGTSPA